MPGNNAVSLMMALRCTLHYSTVYITVLVAIQYSVLRQYWWQYGAITVCSQICFSFSSVFNFSQLWVAITVQYSTV